MLPPGTRVRLQPEPATDRVDGYGRLLRYVVRARDGLNVNVRLVAVGAAAPYFYNHQRGRYANLLERLAKRARARKLGLWRACPRTRYALTRGSQRGDRLSGLLRAREPLGQQRKRDRLLQRQLDFCRRQSSPGLRSSVEGVHPLIDQSSSVNQAIHARPSATPTTPSSKVKSVAGLPAQPRPPAATTLRRSRTSVAEQARAT